MQYTEQVKRALKYAKQTAKQCGQSYIGSEHLLMGLMLAFILGFPANEIVLPIAIMGYRAQGSLTAVDSGSLLTVLQSNGWTWQRAVSMLLFTLLHWPCSTTLLTIRRETGSRKWTALAFLLPTVLGIALCCLFTAVFGA